MAYRDVVLATRPEAMIAYYELNGNLNDSSPNGLTGAAGTDVTYSPSGIDGTQTAVFNGTSSNVDLGANFRAAIDALSMDEFTILLWVRARTDSVWAGNGRTLFYLHTDTELDVNIYAGSSSRFLNIELRDPSANEMVGVQAGMSGTDWHMVAVTFDNGEANFYIDGLFDTQTDGSWAWGGDLDESFVGGFTANFWDGSVDEVTLWGTALSEAEIIHIYNAGAEQFNSIPVVGTNAVVQIFDRTGVAIGELNPLIDFVSWRRNNIGQAQFTIAKSDPKANDTFLSAQNRVLILFDNGLPNWGGIMQPDFTIDDTTITVKLLTAEVLLNGRITDRARYFNNATVGEIAAALINDANANRPTGIDLGMVWQGGDVHSPEYHYKRLLTIFQESLFRRLSDADFYTVPVLAEDGRLTFTLHIVERRGGNLPGVALHQGLNVMAGTKVDFQGPIINAWTVIGDGDGWGDSRPVAVARDEASIDRYGLLEAAEIQQGVVFLTTLQANADNLLAQTSLPRVMLDITAVNLPPATFVQYDLGDVIAVELPDYGIGSAFVGAAKVEARAFYPKDGRLNLVLETVAGS